MHFMGAETTEDGQLRVTFASDDALHVLEGTPAEISHLGERMHEASVLGGVALAEREVAWLPEVTVGDDQVAFGVGGEHVRIRITRGALR